MQGSWIVRQSVGSTPCILGKAVDCNYIRGPKYLEVSTIRIYLYTYNLYIHMCACVVCKQDSGHDLSLKGMFDSMMTVLT